MFSFRFRLLYPAVNNRYPLEKTLFRSQGRFWRFPGEKSLMPLPVSRPESSSPWPSHCCNHADRAPKILIYMKYVLQRDKTFHKYWWWNMNIIVTFFTLHIQDIPYRSTSGCWCSEQHCGVIRRNESGSGGYRDIRSWGI